MSDVAASLLCSHVNELELKLECRDEYPTGICRVSLQHFTALYMDFAELYFSNLPFCHSITSSSALQLQDSYTNLHGELCASFSVSENGSTSRKRNTSTSKADHLNLATIPIYISTGEDIIEHRGRIPQTSIQDHKFMVEVGASVGDKCSTRD